MTWKSWIVMPMIAALVAGSVMAPASIAACAASGTDITLSASCCCPPGACATAGATGPGLTRECCDLVPVPEAPAPLVLETVPAPLPGSPAVAMANGMEETVTPSPLLAETTGLRPTGSPPFYDLFCTYLI